MSATKMTADEISIVCIERDNRLSAWVMDKEHNTYELYTLKCGGVPADVWVGHKGNLTLKVHEPGQYATLPDGPWDAGIFQMWCKAFATAGTD